MSSNSLKIALPKGSLQDATLQLFREAGFNIYSSERGLRPSSSDSELDIYMIRAQEIARYIDLGFVDCGITGLDWAQNYLSSIIDLKELPYSRKTVRPTKWVLVVAQDSPIQKPEDIAGKRIATEGIHIVENYLREKNIEAEVEFSWGATEVKVPDLVDAIVDVTETGSSIRANNLRIVDTLLTSFPHFYANKDSYQEQWKKEKMAQILLMVSATLEARSKVGLKMNLPKSKLPAILELLPADTKPTIAQLTDNEWIAIEVIIEEKNNVTLIPQLKKYGATSILEYPLTKMIN